MQMIEKGLLSSHLLKMTCESMGARFAIITDTNVVDLYGNKLLKQLLDWKLNAELFTFPAGEIHKTRETKQLLEDQMLSRGFGRDSVILALGGGVVTDLVGFLASTYCRGVSLILLPTTLLGVVDASIGGKCGVNTPLGKNMIGSYYTPDAVFFDLDCLSTLPVSEIKNGQVEMIKHALIGDLSHFQLFESKNDYALILKESCEIKKSIINEDLFDEGKRRLLNFGHTVGHAIETFCNYEMSHGTAIAAGIIAEAHISFSLGYLSKENLDRIVRVLLLFTKPCDATPYALIALMTRDKKSLNSKPRFVLLKDIGVPMDFNGAYCTHVDEKVIQDSLQWTMHVLRSDQRAVAHSNP